MLHNYMWHTCVYDEGMSKMIQIRNVPDDIHTTMKDRAAREGMSLSDYLKKELGKLAERPTMREWLDLTRQLKPARGKIDSAKLIRELRDAR